MPVVQVHSCHLAKCLRESSPCAWHLLLLYMHTVDTFVNRCMCSFSITSSKGWTISLNLWVFLFIYFGCDLNRVWFLLKLSILCWHTSWRSYCGLYCSTCMHVAFLDAHLRSVCHSDYPKLSSTRSSVSLADPSRRSKVTKTAHDYTIVLVFLLGVFCVYC